MSVFKKFTTAELKSICKSNNIGKYSKLNKQQLIDLLEQVEEPSRDVKILLLWSANAYVERYCSDLERSDIQDLFEDCSSATEERYTWYKEYHCPNVCGMDYEDLEEQFGEELETLEKEHPKWSIYDKYLVTIIEDNEDIDSEDEEEEEEIVNNQCKCGQPAHQNDMCGHGVADGRCCVCEECKKEMESEEEDNYPYGQDTDNCICSICEDNMKHMATCPDCEEYVCKGCWENHDEEHENEEEPTICGETCGLCDEVKEIKGYCDNGQCGKSVCEDCCGCNNDNGDFFCCEECKPESDEKHDEQYEQKCAQCPTILGENVGIFCMSNQFTDEQETVCCDCRNDIKWAFGWIDDTEEEIDITDLSIFKVKELKSLCKSKGIKGYSKLRKQQLLDLLVKVNGCGYCEEPISENNTKCNDCEKKFCNDCIENEENEIDGKKCERCDVWVCGKCYRLEENCMMYMCNGCYDK